MPPSKNLLDSTVTSDRYYQRDLVLRHILRPSLQANQDRLDQIVQGLGQALGWHWIGIGRLQPAQNRITVLSWWRHPTLGKPFDYALASSPCQMAYSGRDFCHFPAVPQSFPDWGLNDTVQGTVYCAMPVLHKGQPLGHIFALHNDNSVDVELMEDVLRILASFLNDSIASAPSTLSRKTRDHDTQTGLPRLATLQKDLTAVGNAFREYLLSDTSLLRLTPQGLRLGGSHQVKTENKALIAWLIARLQQLSRPMDRIYRIADQQLAWLVPNAGPKQIAWLSDELSRLHWTLSAPSQSQAITLQIGHACLTELNVNESAQALLARADERLQRQACLQLAPQRHWDQQGFSWRMKCAGVPA